MKEIIRNSLAAMAGAIVGIVLIAVIQTITSRLYPMPAGVSHTDKAAMGEFIRTLPIQALLLVLFGYLLGVFAGAWIAGRLSLTHPLRQAVMVTILFGIATLLNLSSFPHPIWFWVANLAVVYAAGRLAIACLPKPAPDAAS
jgi:uncharacterized membrane protein YfcA